MGAVITKLGSEYKAGVDLAGVTFTVGLYNDGTDKITYQHDMVDITTEPSNGNYAAQTFTSEIAEGTQKAICRNTGNITFDVTSTTGTVDSYYISVSFQSTFNGDGSPTEHLIATGKIRDASGQVTLDLSTLSTYTIDASFVGFLV
jgi:hypothetical protein